MKRIEELGEQGRCGYLLTDEAGEVTTCLVRILYEDGNLLKPVVYAPDYSVISDATMFLREAFRSDSDNTRLQAASAIKLLYSYLGLLGLSLDSMTALQARGLVEFMRGTLRSSSSCEIVLRRTREEGTVSDYLSVIRRLVSYLDLGDGHPLLKRKSRIGGWRSGGGWRSDERGYDIGVKTTAELMAPKYVSTSQYLDLLETKHLKDSLRDRVIVRLMGEHGLRIGEVLGLTLEDICSYVDDDGLVRYFVEIRNRLSDAPYQHAKTAMKVRREVDYRLAAYGVAMAGYEIVTLGDDLADELALYVESAHMLCQGGNYWARRAETAKADAVTRRSIGGEENHYIFLNTLGRPLSQCRWSQILREVYEEAGIPIDHGLRHGFAMYLKHDRGCDEYEVMVLMRHSSLKSQEAYDNPVPEDILRLQERIIDGRR